MSEVPHEPLSLPRAAALVGCLVLGLWVLWAVAAALDLELYRWGIYPREITGLGGILMAPLIHGSWAHLFANTLPLLVLGTMLLYGYPRSAPIVVPALWLGSGLGVWLFGRTSFHIGASGLAHGLMFFLFVVGLLRRDRRAMALALLVFFLYGGMVATILPHDPAISFESHLFGALTGILLALLLRRRDPPPPTPRYSWEEDSTGYDGDPFEPGRTDANPRAPPSGFSLSTVPSTRGRAYPAREARLLARVLPLLALAGIEGNAAAALTVPPEVHLLEDRVHATASVTRPRAQTAYGTGWVSASGYVVTCEHVVEGYDEVMLIRPDKDRIPARVVARDRANDIAILQVSENAELPLGLALTRKTPPVGTSIFTVGYPLPDLLGQAPTLARGQIRSLSGLNADPRFYRLSLSVQGGNSGSPVLTLTGEVMGMTAAKLVATSTSRQARLLGGSAAYAVKAAPIRRLLGALPRRPVPTIPVGAYTLKELAPLAKAATVLISARPLQRRP